MTDPDLIGLFIDPLERQGLAYMITGGVASVVYGDPRFTRDIDIVLELSGPSVSSLTEAFSSSDFYLPPLEVLYEEAARKRQGHFKIIHLDTALRADVYLLGDDPLHAWAFPRRIGIPLEKTTAVWLAPVEYVVLRKLEYYDASGSERHLRDISTMLLISGETADQQELERWVGRLGLQRAWESAREFDPEP